MMDLILFILVVQKNTILNENSKNYLTTISEIVVEGQKALDKLIEENDE